MSTERSLSLFFLSIGALVLALLLYLGVFVNNIVRPAGSADAIASFTIAPGANLREISDTLATAGLVTSPRAFQVYIWLRGWSRSLQAGDYTLTKDRNIRELAHVLLVGDAVLNERTITIIEGWTLADIAAYLERQGIVSREDFLKAADRQAAHASVSVLADKPASASLEGYLFPDSYRIYVGASADEILSKMLTTLDQRFTSEMRSAVLARGQTLHQTLILASILEREIKIADDLPNAAGVFMNRLLAGELLQSDATLNYVLPRSEQTPRLRSDQLGSSSPYNTYRYPGLPPTPISNPGLNAIRAAVWPAQTADWYFLTDEQGATHFGKTYAEHLANKRVYLK